MPQKPTLKALFRRIFAGSATNQEKKDAARWLSDLDVSTYNPQFDEIEAQRMRFQHNFHRRYALKQKEGKVFRLSVWLPAAAAAVLLIVAGSLWLVPRFQVAPVVHYTQISTRAGERKIITLPDGSVVTLNNLSRLQFAQPFTGAKREISLNGEAFFEVVHNKARPFIVHAGKSRVQVLGTSFNIHRYAGEPVQVTVATGKVGVLTGGKAPAIMLGPGEQLTFDPLTGNKQQLKGHTTDYTDWQNGEMVFKNENLETICKRLERAYGVKVTIQNSSLKQKKVTLRHRNESLGNILDVLGQIAGFHYRVSGKEVTIN